MSIEEQLSALMEKYTKLQVKNKQLKAWQKVMQNEVDTAQEAELELLALRDENKQLKEFIKWGERKEVYKAWLTEQAKTLEAEQKAEDAVREALEIDNDITS